MRINWDRSIMIALCLWAAMEADCSMENNPPVLEANTESASSTVKAYTQDEINALYAKANEIWNHFCRGEWERYDGPVVPVLELLANRLENIRAWIDKYHKCRAEYNQEIEHNKQYECVVGGVPGAPAVERVGAFSEFYSKKYANNHFFGHTAPVFPSLEHYAENLKDKAALVSILADRAERVLQSLESARNAPPSASQPSEQFSPFPELIFGDAPPSAALTRSSFGDAPPSAAFTRSSFGDAPPSAAFTRSSFGDAQPQLPDNAATKGIIKQVLGDLLPTVLVSPELNNIEAHTVQLPHWSYYRKANPVRNIAKNLQEAYKNANAKIMTWNNSHSPTDPHPAEDLANFEKCYEEFDAALHHRGGTGAGPCNDPFAFGSYKVRVQIQRLRELVVNSSEPPNSPYARLPHYWPSKDPGFLDLLLKK